VRRWGIDPNQLEQQLGEVRWFAQQHLDEWAQLWQLCHLTEQFVRQQGLMAGCHRRLAAELPGLLVTERTQRVRDELVDFVAQQSAQAHPDERLCGSSEIIESVLGKFKLVEGEYTSGGFTSTVLSIAAMVGSTTRDVVQRALETVPTKAVREWTRQHLGLTLQAQRKQLFRAADEAEQKQHQLPRVA